MQGYYFRGVILGISKAFNRVLHKGLILKLKQNAIFGDLLNVLSDFLRNRKQRVMLTVQTCSWEKLGAVVPQECILGRPLV